MARKSKTHTPVMQQYLRAKGQHPDAIVFFRLGDFYEMFFEDAVRAAELLDITLTSRGKGPDGEDIPMAGVPHHAAAGYLTRLIEEGQMVAVCEQMADPSTVKGVVPREVVRVVTPGLCIEPNALDERANNYLASVWGPDQNGGFGLAALELSAGHLAACGLPDLTAVIAQLVRLEPRELLLPPDAEDLSKSVSAILPTTALRRRERSPGDVSPTDKLRSVFGDAWQSRFGSALPEIARIAAAESLRYAEKHQPDVTQAVHHFVRYDPGSHLLLDDVAVRNLEIVRTLDGQRKGSLLHILDGTRTSMGARLLRQRLLSPLTDIGDIRRRHDAVEALVADAECREDIRKQLGHVGDFERAVTRAALGVATPKDLGVVRDALGACGALAELLAERSVSWELDVPREGPLTPPEDLCAMVETQLRERLTEAPPAVPHQGGIIRDDVEPELDQLRTLSTHSKETILAIERRERERTGIGSLKVKFNRVFGYYIEVTRTHLKSVPGDYRRKQTIANGERFVTDELVETQEKITHADDRARALETDLFVELRRLVAERATALQRLSSWVADVDVHAALADVAHRRAYVRPDIDSSTRLELQNARHPVVEAMIPPGGFVPNDILIDAQSDRLVLITGPNMAGKSTVMRQTALCVVMAQAGSFVPASRASIGLVDRIHTRVGASDNLGQGQSTFMVEMRETATMLSQATDRSLVILDEIGRGTSTYDGLAIAWAVAEYLHDEVRCRSLFATHYHELCALAGQRSGIRNVNVAAREHEGRILFMHQILKGPANRSYGVHVARLAGVPDPVVERARTILAELEREKSDTQQLDLFAARPAGALHNESAPSESPPKGEREAIRALRDLDADRLTPLDALVELARIRALVDGEPE